MILQTLKGKWEDQKRLVPSPGSQQKWLETTSKSLFTFWSKGFQSIQLKTLSSPWFINCKQIGNIKGNKDMLMMNKWIRKKTRVTLNMKMNAIMNKTTKDHGGNIREIFQNRNSWDKLSHPSLTIIKKDWKSLNRSSSSQPASVTLDNTSILSKRFYHISLLLNISVTWTTSIAKPSKNFKTFWGTSVTFKWNILVHSKREASWIGWKKLDNGLVKKGLVFLEPTSNLFKGISSTRMYRSAMTKQSPCIKPF